MLSIPDQRKNINSNECCFAFETEICGSDGDFLNYVSGMQLKTTVEFINFPCNNLVNLVYNLKYCNSPNLDIFVCLSV